MSDEQTETMLRNIRDGVAMDGQSPSALTSEQVELLDYAQSLTDPMTHDQARIYELGVIVNALRLTLTQQHQAIERLEGENKRLRSCKAKDERGQLLQPCGHSTYWIAAYGTCMACRAEQAESSLQAMTTAREEAVKVREGYDKWLQGGIYYTTEEHDTLIADHKQQLASLQATLAARERRIAKLEGLLATAQEDFQHD